MSHLREILYPSRLLFSPPLLLVSNILRNTARMNPNVLLVDLEELNDTNISQVTAISGPSVGRLSFTMRKTPVNTIEIHDNQYPQDVARILINTHAVLTPGEFNDCFTYNGESKFNWY